MNFGKITISVICIMDPSGAEFRSPSKIMFVLCLGEWPQNLIIHALVRWACNKAENLFVLIVKFLLSIHMDTFEGQDITRYIEKPGMVLA